MKIPSLNLVRTCCVQKLFLTFRTIFVHNMFCKNESFWQRITCTGKSLSEVLLLAEHVVYKNCSECQKQFLYTICYPKVWAWNFHVKLTLVVIGLLTNQPKSGRGKSIPFFRRPCANFFRSNFCEQSKEEFANHKLRPDIFRWLIQVFFLYVCELEEWFFNYYFDS